MAISFYSHGACREVTGSKHFLAIDDDLLQVDCGMFQGRREEAYQKNLELGFDPAKVSAILLTHAHYDHSAALPIMVKKGFQGNIFSTSASRDVANIILMDSAHIQQKDNEYIKQKIKQHPERALKLYDPFYGSVEAVQAMSHFVTVDYHRPFLPMNDVEATFFDAGHILGSSLVNLRIQNRLNIAFSGDLGRRGLPIIRDPEILPEIDYLVLESTYGNRLHKPIATAMVDLAEIINRAVKRRGKIIIPAFTIERTQELIYLMRILRQEKRIPKIPIFIDSPMAINATSIFKVHPECFDEETVDRFVNANQDPFSSKNIHYTASTRQSIAINSFADPAVIISASGMAESGRILHHLANHIEDSRNIIAIVGFMADHTLGRRLVEKEKEVTIFGKSYQLKAEVEILNAFSAHADYQETCDWVSRHNLRRLKKIFLVHGEDEALAHLQSKLHELGVAEVEIVEYRKTYSLKES